MNRWMVTRTWLHVPGERYYDAIEAAVPGQHQSMNVVDVGDAEPVFTLIVMSNGQIIINNDQARPVDNVVTMLRHVADGFESGDARRVR